MKIKSLRISNIISFRHFDNIDDCQPIEFDSGMNILIGENGSGKSTVVEILNFIFKKVLFQSFAFNSDQYQNRNQLDQNQRQQVITYAHQHNINGFRLDANWNTPEKPRKIKIDISLDEIDKKNLTLLKRHHSDLKNIAETFSSNQTLFVDLMGRASTQITLEISIEAQNFSIQVFPGDTDLGYLYLYRYHYLRELINVYNITNTTRPIGLLAEPFSLLGSYRNYNAFTPSVSLGSNSASQQIQDIKIADSQKSSNQPEPNEPSIFNWVRLRLAQKHYELFETKSAFDCEEMINKEPFLLEINQKLKLVNLKVQVSLVNRSNWSYSFEFQNLKTGRIISNIANLSAGQKSILHLVFEAYGRGELKGGLIIIDEPEIHLHHQFQYEYLQIIKEINASQKCQYILVTHSESLITSDTIHSIKRFALDSDNNTFVVTPRITSRQKSLVKILDNNRSTFAFFAKKVILVEGDSDRYFFRSVLNELHPELNQEIAIIDIGGKGNFEEWNTFFTSYGLDVFFIGDFDNVFSLKIDGSTIIPKTERSSIEISLRQDKLNSLNTTQHAKINNSLNGLIRRGTIIIPLLLRNWEQLINLYRGFVKLNYSDIVRKTRSRNPNLNADIESKYSGGVFILKNGDLETYLELNSKDLDLVISFCQNDLKSWLISNKTVTKEVKKIISFIIN